MALDATPSRVYVLLLLTHDSRLTAGLRSHLSLELPTILFGFVDSFPVVVAV